jgi:hypothetical protein
MIIGVHALIYSKNADAVRAFFRDVIESPSVDAGGGWPIFALPPAELGIHPADEDESHELFLMCDDIDRTLADLKSKGVEIAGEVSERPWGLAASIAIAPGVVLGLYQPKHPTALHLSGRVANAT